MIDFLMMNVLYLDDAFSDEGEACVHVVEFTALAPVVEL